MAKAKAVGIDLGTTYSAMAWVDEANHSALIANAEGDLLTPSVVLFEDKETIVGKEAKKVAVLSPDRVASCVKRDMGKPIYSRPIRGKYLPPEVIQSYILKKLKEDVGRAIGPDFRAVITVPAYFDETRRKATYQSGEMAGLKVLDIVNEPTAAALAFGEDLGYLTRFGAPRQRINVVVYDLGGGTFDVTLIDMQAGDLRTICTDGDVQLGGYDWDMRLVDYMAEVFSGQHHVDPRQSPAGLQRMLLAAEEAKHTLSARNRATIHLTHEGKSADIEISRETFEERTADLLERTRYTTRQLLIAAGLEWKQIGRILLTGGSTRMPMVVKMLRELSGIEPDMTVNPDEAVARGAAIYANYLLASKGETGHAPTFDVTNVNAHSLGVEGIDQQTMRKRNKILIPRNTPLPAKEVKEFVTKQANQSTVVVQVLEGESLEPQECTPIGRTVIRNLPPNLPTEWPVDVTFEYGVNGRLTVRAKIRGTDRAVDLDLERDDSMSADRVTRWKRHVAAAAGLDAFELAIQEELDNLKRSAPPSAGGPPRVATTAAWQPPAAGAPTTIAPTPAPPLPNRPLPNRPLPAKATTIAGGDDAVVAAVVADAPPPPPAGRLAAKPPPASAQPVMAKVVSPASAAAAATLAPRSKPQPAKPQLANSPGAAPTNAGLPGWVAPLGYGILALGMLLFSYYLLAKVYPPADFFHLFNKPAAASPDAGKEGAQPASGPPPSSSAS